MPASAPDAIVLMGPTGSGKSALAMRLASRWPVEIVSVDSAQVYRGMDIGTAKPTPAQRAVVAHHLIDICDPADPYSAGRFARDATALIGQIRARGRVPLLVGGTMLYFRALSAPLAPMPEADPQLRARIAERAMALGWPVLHAELARDDAAAARRIRPTDAQRIQRAMEVISLTGRPLSELQSRVVEPTLRLRQFALMPVDRAALNAHLDARFDAMLEAGLLEEVAQLFRRGDLDAQLPSMRAVGYRQLWQHFAGALELPAALEAARRATRQLARRQLTWLRSSTSVNMIRTLEDQGLMPIYEALRQSARGEQGERL